MLIKPQSLSLSPLLAVFSMLWFCDLEVQHWGNRAETTSLISVWSFFSLDWSEWFSVTPVRAGIPEVKSHRVIHLATRSSRWSLANYNNYCILFPLIIAWPLLMLCWSFHFKRCFAGGVDFAAKIPYVMNPDTKGHNARAIFGTNLKIQWLLMEKWLFHPEYSPPKSMHRRNLMWGGRGYLVGYVSPFLPSCCVSCRRPLTSVL